MSSRATRRELLRGGALTGVAVFTGCTGSGSSGGGATVTMPGIEFSPRTVRVDVGAEVTWKNTGSAEHTVVSVRFSDRAASWSFDERVPPGASVTHTFGESGAYEYYCDVHGESSMCGVVLVGEPAYGGTLPCDGGGGGAY